ncbi:hypothetical protein FIBSPDRAFT_867937 [Athelia psychrophila]|uniref:DUF1996 domain-containing protein n=1 Tax=Athelia psychrophila TaxID=1759441 RepID=A0A166DK12_9AGAM|nr:hypothetical protein FIBSPDRAFT_867937 [Fibularhizoctonia sp. CBS 109695]
MVSSKFTSLLVALFSAGIANAWFRVACTTPLVTERLDPIVSPGVIGSNHVHTGFAPNSSYNDIKGAKCSSCEVVPQVTLHSESVIRATLTPASLIGLLVYYLNRGDLDASNGGKGLKAFPPGFRMVSGNAGSRSSQGIAEANYYNSQAGLAQAAIQYSCLRYTGTTPGYNGYGFPNTACEAGYNARIQFQSCWDGVNLDSPNHQSHVAYLSGLDNGACPSTHPVGLMHVMYEITWNVNDFAGRWTEPNWPFVYATGDPTGFSEHGDFQSGWDQTAMQNAIDHCNNPNDSTGSGNTTACPYLTVIDAAVANTCKINPVVNEATGGVLAKLPGCNPIQAGPGNATFYTTANCPI